MSIALPGEGPDEEFTDAERAELELDRFVSLDWVADKVDPTTLSDHVIDHDRWDEEDWTFVHDTLPPLRKASDDLCQITPTGKPLIEDFFYSVLKASPELTPTPEVRPSFYNNRFVIAQAKELPEWREVRRSTQGDPLLSAMAAMACEPQLATLSEQMKKQQEELQQLEQEGREAQDADDAAQTIEEMLADLEGAGQDELAEELRPEAETARAEATALSDELGKKAEDLERSFEADLPGARMQLQEALSDAAEDARQTLQAAKMMGMEPGELRRLPVAERLKLAKKLDNPRLRQMADLFGSELEFAFSCQRNKINYLREEIHDITRGRDLPRVLPSEMAKFHDPVRRLEFMRGFSEGSLPQYEMRGTEKLAKGGIVLCKDASGSMSGQPEIWATATGLCFLSLARKQNRSFLAIDFGYASEQRVIRFMKPEDYTTERIIEFTELFYGGGTDFMAPIDLATKHLEEEFMVDGRSSGDIVFLTDGAAKVTDSWFAKYEETKKRLDFAFWGVQIGRRWDDTLDRLSDNHTFTVRDFVTGGDIQEVFRSL